MSTNMCFYKLFLVKNFLDVCAQQKQELLDELIVFANDPVINLRRMRMLSQLNEFEAQILRKIHAFETDDINDYDLWLGALQAEVEHVCNRSA